MVMNRLIKEMIDSSGLSVDDISNRTGYKVDEINAVINGSAVTTKMAFNICDAIGIDLVEILKA